MFLEKYSEEVRKLMKLGFILFSLIALFFALEVLSSLKEYRYIGKGVYPAKTISVSGVGEVYAVPDIGRFTFSITERASTVAKAQRIATEKGQATIDALRGAGVEEKDIKTEYYSINPRYEYQEVVCVRFPCPGQQVLIGYEVSQTVAVKVRDLAKAGELVSLVTSAGATGVSGLEFTVDDIEAVKTEARALAIANAKIKADQLEKDLGVKFVSFAGFYENEYPMPYDKAYGLGGDMMRSEVAMMAPTLPTGENQITVQVTLMYEIK